MPTGTTTLSGASELQLQNSDLNQVNSPVASDYHWQSETHALFNSVGSVIASVGHADLLALTIKSHKTRVGLARNNQSERLIQLSPNRESFWSGETLKIQFNLPENRINSVIYFDAKGQSSLLINSRVSYEKQLEEITVSVTAPFGNETLVLISDSLDQPSRKLWSKLHRESISLNGLLNDLNDISNSSILIDAETFLTLEKP